MKKTQWNINTSLQPFFKDARVFRSIQGKTETLIGSEFAGKFFRRLQVKTGLELFTATAVNADTITEYLEREGCLLENAQSGDEKLVISKASSRCTIHHRGYTLLTISRSRISRTASLAAVARLRSLSSIATAFP
jgi:hypothetical protein